MRAAPSVLAAILSALALAACASPSWRGALADAGDLPPHARAELVLIAASDPEAAADLAEQALSATSPESPAAARALFALIVASDALGELERPLASLVPVLLATADPQVAARLVPESARAWARLDGRDPASPELRAALERLAERPGDAWEEVRALARRELVTAERLRAGPAAARAASERAGYLLEWRLSAPWGDAPSLDFLSPLGPETRPLAAHETTGLDWDLVAVPTTDETFSDGEVTFFDLPRTGGVGFAEAALPPSPAARRVVLRLECNRACALFIDGVPIVSRALPTASWLQVAVVDLPAGAHRLTTKLATHDGRGFFRVQLSELMPPALPPAAVTVHPPAPSPAPGALAPGDARAAIAAVLALEERLSRPRWDPDDARARQAALEESFGPHIVLDLLAARLAMGDLVVPVPARRQAARRRYERVLAVDPDNPVARRGLARLERDEDRFDRALALLAPSSDAGADPAGAQPAPRDARTALELLDLYRERGWEVEALAIADALRPRAEVSPRILQELVDLYRAFGRVERAAELAELLERRFPGSGATRLYELLADRGDVRPPLALEAFAVEPQRHTALRDGVGGLRRQPDLAAAVAVVDAFLARRPHDGWALAERVRIALQAGDLERARAAIRAALAAHPDYAPLESLLHHLDGTPEPFDTLEDGRALVRRFDAFVASPEGASWASFPVVNLLDRARIDVRADGSTLELVHRVRLVQTKQGADALGDVRPPDDARLLVARTLKADGRVLEPERTEGKAELSFPELQPGDALEIAWVSRSRVFPSEGGYLTGVSFAAWGAPIFELDQAITTHAGLDLALTGFGAAPAPARSATPTGGQMIAWRLSRLTPIAREPLAVSTRSFFPFTDVRVVRADEPPAARNDAAWRRIARAYASRLHQLAHPGPRLLELSARFSRERDPAAAAFAWVKKEVTDQEQLNTFETAAEAAIATRKGNRALVLWALLRARSAEARLLLCAPERDGRPEDAAQPTPNANRFFYPIVASTDGALFDPARPYTPPGDLPPELGGATCLVPPVPDGVDLPPRPPASPPFVTLPSAPTRPSFESELTLHIDADGHARGTLVGTAHGAAASPLRQAWLAQDEARRRILFEQWLASLALGARLLDYEVHDADEASRPMRWRLDVEIPGYAERDGPALVVRRPLKTLVHADFAGVVELAQLVSSDKRLTPLRLLPLSERVTLTLSAPPHLRFVPPPDVAFGRDAARPTRLTQTSATSPGGAPPATLVVTRRVVVAPGRVDPSEYDSFRREIGAVIRGFDAPIRLEPAR